MTVERTRKTPEKETRMRWLLFLGLVGCVSLGCASARFEPVVAPLGYDAGGSCTPRGGPPTDAALLASAEMAEREFADILATLANERDSDTTAPGATPDVPTQARSAGVRKTSNPVRLFDYW